VIRLSAGGTAIRLRLSNELSAQALHLGVVRVATWKNGRVVPGSDRVVRFTGRTEAVIEGGAAVVSDSIDLAVPALGSLAISIYVPGPATGLTAHLLGQQMSWFAAGDQTARTTLQSSLPTFVRHLVTAVEVASSSQSAGTIAILGDSITDGYRSSFDANKRWPDGLAERLIKAGRDDRGVANLGIAGNQLLRDGDGIAAVSRLDRDVFSLPNVDTLIVFEGVNDLGYAIAERRPLPTAQELQAGYLDIVEKAHARGIKVVGCTLLPYRGSGDDYYSIAGDDVRRQINTWMRTSGVFDAVAELEAVAADKNDPLRLAPLFDSGDKLHPNDAGYAAIARAFDLQILRLRLAPGQSSQQ
jgi:lysophospholipase L1-like esterase